MLTTIPAAVAVARPVVPRAATIAAGPVPTPIGSSATVPIVKRTRQTWAGSEGNPNAASTIQVLRSAMPVKPATTTASLLRKSASARTPRAAVKRRWRKRSNAIRSAAGIARAPTSIAHGTHIGIALTAVDALRLGKSRADRHAGP